MKNNTIKLALRAKVKELLDTVDDPTVKSIMEDNILVCGGAIASMLLNERPNDYDIYFKSFEATEAVARYYVDKFNKLAGELPTKGGIPSYNPAVKTELLTNIRGEEEHRVLIYMKSSGVAGEAEIPDYQYYEMAPEMAASEYIEAVTSATDVYTQAEEVIGKLGSKKPKFRPVFLTDNAITLSDKVQLILRFYGDVNQIHKNYDYAHAMCSFDFATSELVLHTEALASLLNRSLVYRGSLYPIASLFRIRKFMKRGWSITAGQMLKIIWQINELDLKNEEVLKDQLIGVDQAYMSQLIGVLSNREKSVQIDSIYIAKIIDEIFD